MRLFGLFGNRDETTRLPFDMFDATYPEAEARRARRMENIYHVGQAKIWDGRDVLAQAIARHGKPDLAPEKRKALARVFGMIMWGELAAWKISAQLADRLVPLEAKLAAASQVHDEARHFYVMHDYLEALGEKPARLEFFAQRVLERTLGTHDLLKKLIGMQLTVETVAFVAFQRVREIEVEPVLSELMTYYERDEARHIGLGIQLVPQMVSKLSLAEAVSLAVFQLDLLTSTLFSLKTIERELLTIGVDPRSMLGMAFRKQADIDTKIRAEFPQWPADPPLRRVFEGVCEVLFPSEGAAANVPVPLRMKHALEVIQRSRESVFEQWGTREKDLSPSFSIMPPAA
ncbi:MAG TPA: ferritin-like domain-containing protein [Polyangiaceae bacterium]|nr:ferritin-like domain-containing protein [Polyangiaceae bacterium]